MQASLQGKENVIKQLKTQISYLQETRGEAYRTLDFRALDSQITQLTEKFIVLQEQNDLFRAENEKIKHHYKEFVIKDHVKPIILAPGQYAIDVEPIPPYLRNNRVYYVEGLGHNLFFVGQFCDSDLEVAFKKHSCYVRDTNGVDLIKGSRGTNLYTISVEDMMKSSPICLLSKASKNKSWLWHRRLNHLNFGTINDLARKDLVR
nr:integrase, catalytic region, zinc finger, CCHC-type, peptidase aspartic, catalytic [Tanacetum cinerariifolium]